MSRFEDGSKKNTANLPKNIIGSNNRGNDVKVTPDSASPISVTLESINEILLEYFTNRIKPQITENDATRIVPIIYGTPERWATIRKDGYLRNPDTTKLYAPLIVLRRVSVGPGNIVNPNNKYIYRTFDTGWNSRQSYDRFMVQNSIMPSKKLRTVIVPDYVDLSYEGFLWTEYQEQMDELIQQINVENEDYWGERNDFKFRIKIDEFNSEDTTLPTDQDRLVRTEFNMKVAAYLIPEKMVKKFQLASTNDNIFTPKKIIITEQVVSSFKLPLIFQKDTHKLITLITSSIITSGSASCDAKLSGLAINADFQDSFCSYTSFNDWSSSFNPASPGVYTSGFKYDDIQSEILPPFAEGELTTDNPWNGVQAIRLEEQAVNLVSSSLGFILPAQGLPTGVVDFWIRARYRWSSGYFPTTGNFTTFAWLTVQDSTTVKQTSLAYDTNADHGPSTRIEDELSNTLLIIASGSPNYTDGQWWDFVLHQSSSLSNYYWRHSVSTGSWASASWNQIGLNAADYFYLVSEWIEDTTQARPSRSFDIGAWEVVDASVHNNPFNIN